MNKILGYRYAELHQGKYCYIDYYVTHPITTKWCRKRIKLNHIISAGKRKSYAKKLINKIDNKLDAGWNPFLEENAHNEFITVTGAAAVFLQFKKDELKKDNIRPRTFQTYENQVNRFRDGINREYVFQITSEDAFLFMDKLSASKEKFGPGAYNDWVINMRIFFNWLVKRNYTKFNPFKNVDQKREPKLQPQSISRKYFASMREYCLEKDIYQWILCSWVFYCALRRTELTRLKIGAINFETQKIKILHTESKNHFETEIIIPDELFALLLKLNYDKLPREYYLVTASRGSQKGPGPVKTHPNTINAWFRALREKLDIPDNIKFYHFKHTMLTKIAASDPVAAKHHGRFLRIEDINPYMAENEAQKELIKNFKA